MKTVKFPFKIELYISKWRMESCVGNKTQTWKRVQKFLSEVGFKPETLGLQALHSAELLQPMVGGEAC